MQSFVHEARRDSLNGDNTKRLLAEANQKSRDLERQLKQQKFDYEQ